MKKYILSLFIVSALFSACKKEDEVAPTNDIDPNRKGTIVLEFDNKVGSLGLVLDSPFYTNSFGQNYSISKFDYFISNIVFVNADGTTYVVPQDSSYFLIKESVASSREVTLTIPEGNYTGVRFIVGVDSLRNTKPSGERQGALDVGGQAAGMYWTWNSGYIFLKMEGSFNDPNDTVAANQEYTYHIGGFGGYSSPTINNIKNVSLLFGSTQAQVREEHGAEGPNVHMFVDAAKVISGSTNVNFSENPMVMFSPYSVNIANNYAGMFSVDHVHNHEH